MFQTLKPKKSTQGDVEYVTRSSEVGYSRKSRKQPACASCKIKKLRCSAGDGDSCNPCRIQGNECSYMQEAKSRPQSTSAASQQSTVNGGNDQQRKSEQWSMTTQQQARKQPQQSPHNHRQQLDQEGTIEDLNESNMSYLMDLNESDPMSFNSKMHRALSMPSSSHGVDLSLDNVTLGNFNTPGLTSCDVNFNLTGFLQSDDNENHDYLNQTPNSLSSFLMDHARPNKSPSTSNSPITLDTMLSAKRRIHACQHPAPLQTPPSSTTTSATRQKQKNGSNGLGMEQSPASIEMAETLSIANLPETFDEPHRHIIKEASPFCQCVSLLLSAYERLQLQLVWSYSNGFHDNMSCCVVPEPINVDETLECQRCILTSINALLGCRHCNRRSEHIMLSLSICKEMIRSINVFGDGSSPMPVGSDDGTLASSSEGGNPNRRGSKRPRTTESGGIEPKNSMMTSRRWRLDDQVEMQVVWSLVDLRAKRLKRLIQQLEEIAVEHNLPCLRVAQVIRRQFAD